MSLFTITVVYDLCWSITIIDYTENSSCGLHGASYSQNNYFNTLPKRGDEKLWGLLGWAKNFHKTKGVMYVLGLKKDISKNSSMENQWSINSDICPEGSDRRPYTVRCSLFGHLAPQWKCFWVFPLHCLNSAEESHCPLAGTAAQIHPCQKSVASGHSWLAPSRWSNEEIKQGLIVLYMLESWPRHP